MPTNDHDAILLETRRRRQALMVLAFMILLFIVLSAFSFLGSRDQIVPESVQYAGTFEAVDGKRVFQAYNCMGCHTIVGNGAYFGPDLTNTYEDAGPAWMAAFLPSPGTWPTEAALRVQLQNPDYVAETGITDLPGYYAAYPGAKERIERRGGLKTLMPNLPFRANEVPKLLAFFKYTSLMDTEGWPPAPKVDGLTFALANAGAGNPATTQAAATPVSTSAAGAAPADPAQGQALATEYGCFACHAADASRVVGPGWGGLYGSTQQIEGGQTVTVDDAYLHTAIEDPDAQVAAGYPAGLMPSYAAILGPDEIDHIVAYIRSLETP